MDGTIKEPVDVLVQQGLEILAEAAHMLAQLGQALGLVGALEGAAPDPDHNHRQENRRQAVQQQQNGLVPLGVEIDLLGLIPDFLLLHGAQGHQHGQIVEAAADHKDHIGDFRQQEQQALDPLAVDDVAQAHDQGRELGDRAALGQGRGAGIGSGELPGFRL